MCVSIERERERINLRLTLLAPYSWGDVYIKKHISQENVLLIVISMSPDGVPMVKLQTQRHLINASLICLCRQTYHACNSCVCV